MVNPGRLPCDAGVIRGAREAVECPPGDKPWILAATILGSSMAFIDGSVVNVALPAIQSGLAGSVAAVQWVVNGYLLMLGALILVGGSAGDRFGRRRTFRAGIIVFTAASVVCGVAPDALTLIVARMVQGIGGAMLVPASLAIISASFPDEERGQAIGTWAGLSALTTALGPVLGGWLVDVLSWRVVFFVNLPIAAATLAIAWRHVPESREASIDASVDWSGAVAVALGLGAMTFGLSEAADGGWTQPLVIATLAAAVVALGAFAWIEARVAPAPMMPLGLFRSAVFSGANAITLVIYFALSGVMFFLPFDLIQLQGYSATWAGVTFLPFTLIMAGLSRWSGKLVDTVGPRLPLIAGPLITGAGMALLAVPGLTPRYWLTFMPAMTVVGLGMAVSVAPLTTTVMGAVGQDHAGVASGVNNAVSRIAGLLAVAILTLVAVRLFGDALEVRMHRLDLPAGAREAVHAQASKLLGIAPPASLGAEPRISLAQALRLSFLTSYRATMLICACIAAIGAMVAAPTIKGPKPRLPGHINPNPQR